ncbi:biotin--[acetyl-CoA-carboxylase] ligase [Chromatiales bacterium (ex Bugula neritina AB1)]|nr:biotin--[acetyl-CoA-carboxylase] ligase [Chromatiales bacterium (ex Bugula neritina AB1)]
MLSSHFFDRNTMPENYPIPLSKSAIETALQQQINAIGSVEVLQQTDSTNTRLMSAKTGPGYNSGSLMVCAAEHQTKGRGRRGKPWHTPGGGVTFSLRFSISCGLADVSGLSLLAGAAVCDVLREITDEPIGIKWPNDILAGESKLVGILVEVAHFDASSTCLVVGIGVNYRRGKEARRIDQKSTDLHDLCNGVPPDRSRLISDLAAGVYNISQGDVARAVASLSERWADYDALSDREIQVHAGADVITGASAGIDEKGLLKVTTTSGLRVFSSAEVSVRKV